MKITRIEILLVEIPYVHPFRIALAVMDRARNLVVRIHESQGLIGVGEGSPAPFVTGELPEGTLLAASEYAGFLLGRDPREIQACLSNMEKILCMNPATRCAFDLALHDLVARLAGLPLYSLLGGTRRVLQSNRTLGIDGPEAMQVQARELVAGGARILKIKVGTSLDEDLACIRAVRQAVGPGVLLRVDANQAWDEPTAHAALVAMAAEGIQFCEQPLPAWNEAGLRRLREHSPVPLMADESVFDSHDAFRIACSGAVDYLNIKLGKAGGLLEANRIQTVAAAAGLGCMLGGMSESMIGVSAAAHLMCASTAIGLADLDSPFHFTENPVQGGVDFQPDGRVTLPEGPGHGADLKPEWLERSRRITID